MNFHIYPQKSLCFIYSEFSVTLQLFFLFSLLAIAKCNSLGLLALNVIFLADPMFRIFLKNEQMYVDDNNLAKPSVAVGWN